MVEPSPPFGEEHSLLSIPESEASLESLRRSSGDILIPAAYHRRSSKIEKRVLKTIEDEKDILEWIGEDLDVSRLNIIHKHIWMAGLPQICRPLHEQVMLGREILITERADLHLVWHSNKIFIKPLPDYLLNYKVWINSLCTDSKLFQDANGFLLSYMWLVCRRSDWKVAKDKGLVPSGILWHQWVDFSRTVLRSLYPPDFTKVNPRYSHGELRLGRLDLIYRCCSKTTNMLTLIRGYDYGYHQYSTFVERNFAWVLTATIYLAIVLTAMQVGLATEKLGGNRAFNRASYGFTVFSILAPLIVLVFLLFILGWAFCVNWLQARKRKQETMRQHASLKSDLRISHS